MRIIGGLIIIESTELSIMEGISTQMCIRDSHSMLQRMNELAVQAANGTNSKDTDRKAIQDEIDQLNTEIDRCLLYTSSLHFGVGCPAFGVTRIVEEGEDFRSTIGGGADGLVQMTGISLSLIHIWIPKIMDWGFGILKCVRKNIMEKRKLPFGRMSLNWRLCFRNE